MTTMLSPGERRTPRQKKIDAKVLARVKRGIERLNVQFGPDWVDLVDLDILDLAGSTHCVLGQVYGSYYRGCSILGSEALGDPVRFGFDVDDDKDAGVVDARYDALRDCWVRQLTPRVKVTS